MKASLLTVVIAVICDVVYSVYQGSFQSNHWFVSKNATQEEKEMNMTVLIGLVVERRGELDELLKKVSNPVASEYGKYISATEIAEVSAPAEAKLNELLQWLKKSSGQILMNKSKDMINLKAPIKILEEMFSTRLEWHTHNQNVELSEEQYLRAIEDISVPEEVSNIISFISINSPIITKQAKKASHVADHELFFPNSEGDYPSPGSLIVHGTENSAILGFSLHCWDSTLANPLCENHSDLEIDIEVENVETPFPAMHFTVPLDSLLCMSFSDMVSVPCDPLNQTSMWCTCGVVVGPLPKYSQLSFSVAAFTAQPSDKVQIASSLSPITLLDIVTPTLLRNIYKIPDMSIKHGATTGVAEFIDQFYNNQDLDKFFHLTGLAKENIPKANVYGNKPNNPTYPGGEAMLDVEYLMALTPNASMSYYSTGDCSPFCGASEDFLLWLFFIGCREQPEMVHSVSYGDNESGDRNNTVSVEFFDRIDVEFLKLGLQGSTVVFSSGDDGVCSFATPENPKGCSQAQPTWPSSSPYVTSAGATQLSDKYLPVCGESWSKTFDMPLQCTGVGEVVCQSDKGGIITPGGGFSNVYARPWWQEHAVSTFLEETGKAEGAFPTTPNFFNQSGRGYPDIAVHGALYLVVDNGTMVAESGTSCSAPMFSALITLANDLRLGQGLPPLGFVNPLLYYLRENYPEVFNDITVGNNACRAGHQGGGRQIDCNDKYFAAVPGWDPVSGLGSINFEAFSKIVLEIGQEFGSSEQIVDGSFSEEISNQRKHVMTIDPFNLNFLAPMVVSLLALFISMWTKRSEVHHNETADSLQERGGKLRMKSQARCISAPPTAYALHSSTSIQYGATNGNSKKINSAARLL